MKKFNEMVCQRLNVKKQQMLHGEYIFINLVKLIGFRGKQCTQYIQFTISYIWEKLFLKKDKNLNLQILKS